MIYIIGNKVLDICKIGFSERPNRRIKSIQGSFPFELEILSIREGTRKEEKEMHLLLEDYRINGEWFTLSSVSSKLAGLDVNRIPFLSGFFITNDKGYISLSSLVKLINKERRKRNESLFNTNLFFNRDDISTLYDKMILKEIPPFIDNGFGKWIHKYIAIEICRSSGAKERLNILELYFN